MQFQLGKNANVRSITHDELVSISGAIQSNENPRKLQPTFSELFSYAAAEHIRAARVIEKIEPTIFKDSVLVYGRLASAYSHCVSTVVYNLHCLSVNVFQKIEYLRNALAKLVIACANLLQFDEDTLRPTLYKFGLFRLLN